MFARVERFPGPDMSTSQDQAKLRAAKAGVEFVHDGMILGLGSGSTSELFVRELGERLRHEKMTIRAVATSDRTAQIASTYGIHLIDPESVGHLDLALDGADEVDPEFRMIKGRGGALLREKIVASAANQRIIMVDRSKLVDRLGSRHELPVEVSNFGHRWTSARMAPFATDVHVRLDRHGMPYRTDGGNLILDVRTGPIDNPQTLESQLLAIPGVYETGLFIGLCDILIVAEADDLEIRRKADG
ncbi:ribose-5-phosphate isomerase RpiA [bacterium]|nr:ribose-5-phosphate isomerase RpiA [bacterium]